jgi:transcriptional regulator with PAS, ATPase and Fis domain
VNVLIAPPFAGTGTFTDTKIAKTGLFKAASKGTSFPDKIDVLPLPLQGKRPTTVEEK